MRLDKYLKNSRIIKRRTIAKEACEGGRVSINGKVAKPSMEVEVGDIIEIRFGDKTLKAEITNIAEHVTKDSAKEMFVIID
ncbi:RNA-binding S4 domain-containing protein [Alkaliphilus sp. MSJ-5]|uniref:RQC P-site tRNA stabilizing factor n=1 Tax=Alkaliphilus flagellatus TaxID=2841507 RepID=A0ABS6G528_9FIRM|nr:RNA-binding S4 domain-containing protein [Alkaliphilus flagellatus]MBU5676500.1 RNA-binding S4 domain-containing protein [Alkaliphilus flagellatus]